MRVAIAVAITNRRDKFFIEFCFIFCQVPLLSYLFYDPFLDLDPILKTPLLGLAALINIRELLK